MRSQLSVALAAAIAVVAVVPSALASIVSVSPFVGQRSESFEEFPLYGVTGTNVYLAPNTPIFGGAAVINGNGLVVYDVAPVPNPNYFGTAGGVAQVEDGTQALGGTDPVITFSEPVSEFGGYFADNNLTLKFIFLDAAGAIIGELDEPRKLTGGTLTWYGWQFSTPIQTIEIFGGNTAMDALQANFATPLPAAYITNSGDGTVSVIDTTNNTVVMTIPVGRKPFGVAVTPDDSKVYIANSGDDTVSVIDTATNTVLGSPIAVGTNPVGVAVTPDGKTVYVTNQGDGTVSVINAATNTVIGSAIDVGCPIANCGRKTTNLPTGIAVTPDGSKVYVGNLGAPGYASVIATASNTVTTINTKKVTSGVAVTPDGSKVYFGSLNGVVLAIDVATNSVGHGSTIGVGSGSEGIAVTPDGSKVYVADSAVGTVSVINTGTNKVIGSIAVGSDPQGVSVTSDGSKVYVANEGNGTVDGTVSIIDTATNTVESSTITVGKAPLAFGIFIPPPKPK
jgi:YVTN family beta-propeller protein